MATYFLPIISAEGNSIWPSQPVAPEKQKQFVNDHRSIMVAIQMGDLPQVKKIVASGYNDVDAFSYGVFETIEWEMSAFGDDQQENPISPVNIAKRRKQPTILQFLEESRQPGISATAAKINEQMYITHQKAKSEIRVQSVHPMTKKMEGLVGEPPQQEIKTDQMILWKKPDPTGFSPSFHANRNYKALNILGLFSELSLGPIIAQAKLGPAFYESNPELQSNKLGNHEVYGWPKGSVRKNVAEKVNVIILGLRMMEKTGNCYFMLCEPAPDRGKIKGIHVLKEDQRLFACSHDTFKKFFINALKFN